MQWMEEMSLQMDALKEENSMLVKSQNDLLHSIHINPTEDELPTPTFLEPPMFQEAMSCLSVE